ncbi:hypothetical protein MKEN_00232200 [Mycena kentingensis (nom. inval.)]|nr:hypothetical protein MKEN_00232200 [Mycena kentingensis (nom. inval.)]
MSYYHRSPPPAEIPLVSSPQRIHAGYDWRSPVPKLGYYPIPLFVLILWISYISVLLWLLETAVKHGTETIHQPWHYTTLPSLLITGFAQGHVGISALMLTRVSVSALHSARTSPRSWAEIFWLADKAWQGPFGMLTTIWSAVRMRVWLSLHFCICALVCLIALATPVILSRAYPIQSILVSEGVTIFPTALDGARMATVDAYTQVATGIGTWTSAVSVTEVYVSNIYLPSGRNTSREGDPEDFFLCGNVNGKTATLPGLRLQGQCAVVEDSPVRNVSTSFSDYCEQQVPNIPFISRPISIAGLSAADANLTMQVCNNASWSVVFPPGKAVAKNVGFVYFQANEANDTVKGTIRCESTFSTGSAALHSDGTFSGFTPLPVLNSTQKDAPLLDPMYALMWYFDEGQRASILRSKTFAASAAQALGVTALGRQPDEAGEEIATALWRGVSYMVTSIGLLSRSNSTSFPATDQGVTTVHVRDRRFQYAAYALLGSWLALMLLLTLRSFRPTFRASFDSYLTAKLVVDNPSLVDRMPSGDDFEGNGNLRERFGRVGRSNTGEIVVVEK